MSFDEFLQIMRKSMDLDPWVVDRGLHGFTEEIINEAHEAKEACEKKDYENLKEELGDVMHDVVNACLLAEKDGLFTIDDVYTSAIEKIQRRRPYVSENRKVTKDEAVRIWKEAKAMEKEAKRLKEEKKSS